MSEDQLQQEVVCRERVKIEDSIRHALFRRIWLSVLFVRLRE